MRKWMGMFLALLLLLTVIGGNQVEAATKSGQIVIKGITVIEPNQLYIVYMRNGKKYSQYAKISTPIKHNQLLVTLKINGVKYTYRLKEKYQNIYVVDYWTQMNKLKKLDFNKKLKDAMYAYMLATEVKAKISKDVVYGSEYTKIQQEYQAIKKKLEPIAKKRYIHDLDLPKLQLRFNPEGEEDLYAALKEDLLETLPKTVTAYTGVEYNKKKNPVTVQVEWLVDKALKEANDGVITVYGKVKDSNYVVSPEGFRYEFTVDL